MPSEYTDRLGFELQATGEGLNVWGERLNNALTLIDEAIAGIATISLTGNKTLTNTINTVNEARKAILVFTDGGLSAIPVVTIPPEQKFYYVENRGATYAITITAGGASASVLPGRKVFALCDGTNVTVFDAVSVTADAATAAGASASASSGSATNAAASAVLAQKWAANSENVVVTGSLYSALHYAAKAAASAAAAAMFDPSSYVPKTGNVSLTGNLYDTVVDKGTISSGTVTFSVPAGAVQWLQVGGALTIALSNKPATFWQIELILVDGGAAAITWPTVSWLKGDGTVSSAFADMGVTLQVSGANTVILWGTGSGTVYGRAG